MKKARALTIRSKQGLTLVELIVAFALLAIVVLMLSGPFLYTFRTSIWAKTKTYNSLLTAGELVSYANGGDSAADVTFIEDPNPVPLVLTFGSTTITIPVTYISATGPELNQSGSQPQKYKVFIP